jgi:hypothetical protein
MDAKQLLREMTKLLGEFSASTPAKPNLTLFTDDRLMLAVPFDYGGSHRFDTFLLDEEDTVESIVAFVRAHIEKVRATPPPPPGV